MALNAKTAAGTGTKIEPLESGMYPARVLHVIDLGLQKQPPYKGQEKPPAHMIMLTYEFVDEFLPDEDGNPQEDKPRVLSEKFVLYNLEAEKAKSTQRYKALDPKLELDGDFASLLTYPINVTITQNPGKNGKVFENVAGLAPMRSKEEEKCPELVNEPLVFDLDDPDIEEFKKLHDWIKNLITSNLEFEGSKLQKLLSDDPDYTPAITVAPDDVEEEAELDDENPF